MPDFASVVRNAEVAGQLAAAACTPVPMVVGSPTTLLGNELDASKPVYFVPDGVCGFAWVKIKGTTAFAKFAKKQGLARGPAYGGGYTISAGARFNQSMQKKEAWAYAYAKVLQEAGIDAYVESRMD